MSTNGQLFDIWSKEELDQIVKIMIKLPNVVALGNDCKGINQTHIMYPWFQKNVFNRVQELFGYDLKLIFGMYLNEITPWDIHTDTYHIENDSDKVPALSILFPYSVDNDIDKVENGFTIVFDQKATRYEVNDMVKKPVVENSAVDIYEKHLTHCNLELVKRLTLANEFQWKFGSIIYWDSDTLHTTNDYIKLGFESKQAIVIHTYREK